VAWSTDGSNCSSSVPSSPARTVLRWVKKVKSKVRVGSGGWSGGLVASELCVARFVLPKQPAWQQSGCTAKYPLAAWCCCRLPCVRPLHPHKPLRHWVCVACKICRGIKLADALAGPRNKEGCVLGRGGVLLQASHLSGRICLWQEAPFGRAIPGSGWVACHMGDCLCAGVQTSTAGAAKGTRGLPQGTAQPTIWDHFQKPAQQPAITLPPEG